MREVHDGVGVWVVRGERVVVRVGGFVVVDVGVGVVVLVDVGVVLEVEVDELLGRRLVLVLVLVRVRELVLDDVVLSSTRRSSTGGGSAGEAATRNPRKTRRGTHSITARTSPSRPVRRRFTTAPRPGARC